MAIRRRRAESRNKQGWRPWATSGWLDEEGYLYLTDRKLYMIISGGVNIYPQEIENLLVAHPKVADVAVVGAPHEEMGEEVVAVIQPADWADAGPALAAELARLDPRAAVPRQGPAAVRLHAGAAPPPERQTLQAPDPRRLLGGSGVAHRLTRSGTVRKCHSRVAR